jgi:hypothetical protein
MTVGLASFQHGRSQLEYLPAPPASPGMRVSDEDTDLLRKQIHDLEVCVTTLTVDRGLAKKPSGPRRRLFERNGAAEIEASNAATSKSPAASKLSVADSHGCKSNTPVFGNQAASDLSRGRRVSKTIGKSKELPHYEVNGESPPALKAAATTPDAAAAASNRPQWLRQTDLVESLLQALGSLSDRAVRWALSVGASPGEFRTLVATVENCLRPFAKFDNGISVFCDQLAKEVTAYKAIYLADGDIQLSSTTYGLQREIGIRKYASGQVE